MTTALRLRAPTERPSRRNFLYISTALVGAAGCVAAVWPFIDQMNPDAAARAREEVLAVDVADLKAGAQRIVRWRQWPVAIARRSDAALTWLRAHPSGLRPADPAVSDGRREPSYARNWHRSADPAYGVFVAVC